MKLKLIVSKLKHAALRPLRAMKQFVFIDLRMVMSNFREHDGELSTCALAFFLLISFIPLSLVIIAALSFFYKSETMATFYITQLKNQLPSINIDHFVSIIDRIIYSKRYLAFIWIPFLFWWGSFVFDIIERGLEKAFRIGESRKFWKAKVRHFIIILGIASSIFIITIFSHFFAVIKNIGIAQLIEDNINTWSHLSLLVSMLEKTPYFLSSGTTLLMNTFLIFIIYRFVPPKKLNNRALFKGALFASFSYEVIKSLFSLYISEINDYTSIFGSLNTIVILMIWIWYTCFLFVIGAEMAWVIYQKEEGGGELDFEEPAGTA